LNLRDDAPEGLPGREGHHRRVGVAGERGTVLVDHVPNRAERRFPRHLISIETEDSLGRRVTGDDPATGELHDDALGQRTERCHGVVRSGAGTGALLPGGGDLTQMLRRVPGHTPP
jgi:hypothetical protein